MANGSVLTFNNYSLDKLYFEKNTSVKDGTEFHMKPMFKKDIKEITTDTYDISLSFWLEPADGSNLPFFIDVCLTGHFQLDFSDEDAEALKADILNKNAIAILFPFLRSTVATLTACANVAPLVLPVINLADSLE